MIKEITMYTVICDSCGKDSCAETEYAGWNDEGYAVDCACDDDWIQEGKKDYCPDCYEYDDDGEIIIKNKQQP